MKIPIENFNKKIYQNLQSNLSTKIPQREIETLDRKERREKKNRERVEVRE